MPRLSKSVRASVNAPCSSKQSIEEKTDHTLHDVGELVQYIQTSLCDVSTINEASRELEGNDSAITEWIRTFDREYANRLRDVTHQESLLQLQYSNAQSELEEVHSNTLERKLRRASISDEDGDREATSCHGYGSHEEQMRGVERLKAKRGELESTLEAVVAERRTIAKNVAKLEHYSYKDVDLYKATVAALMSVTQIKWTECTNTRVKGCFLPPHSVKHVKNFEVSRAADSVTTASNLWRQITDSNVPPHIDIDLD